MAQVSLQQQIVAKWTCQGKPGNVFFLEFTSGGTEIFWRDRQEDQRRATYTINGDLLSGDLHGSRKIPVMINGDKLTMRAGEGILCTRGWNVPDESDAAIGALKDFVTSRVACANWEINTAIDPLKRKYMHMTCPKLPACAGFDNPTTKVRQYWVFGALIQQDNASGNYGLEATAMSYRDYWKAELRWSQSEMAGGKPIAKISVYKQNGKWVLREPYQITASDLTVGRFAAAVPCNTLPE